MQLLLHGIVPPLTRKYLSVVHVRSVQFNKVQLVNELAEAKDADHDADGVRGDRHESVKVEVKGFVHLAGDSVCVAFHHTLDPIFAEDDKGVEAVKRQIEGKVEEKLNVPLSDTI